MKIFCPPSGGGGREFLLYTPEKKVTITWLIWNLLHIITGIKLFRMQNFRKKSQRKWFPWPKFYISSHVFVHVSYYSSPPVCKMTTTTPLTNQFCFKFVIMWLKSKNKTKFTPNKLYTDHWKCNLSEISIMYQSIPCLTIPPGGPRGFARSSCPRGRFSLLCLARGSWIKVKVR